MPGAFGIGGGSGGGSPFAGDIVVANDTSILVIGDGESTGFSPASSFNVWFANVPAANTTSVDSVVIGFDAGHGLTTGDDNVFVGMEAGKVNTTGSNNTLAGKQAGLTLTTGSNNVVIGSGADVILAADTDSVVIGKSAQGSGFSAVIGSGAGVALTGVGMYNVLMGFESGKNITDGGQNTAIGPQVAGNLTTGSSNIAIGYTAKAGTTGSNNIGIGEGAASSLTTGSNNICIGKTTDVDVATSGNICIGYQASSQAGDNGIAIGYNAVVHNANGINIGDAFVCDAAANADLKLIPQGTGKVQFGVVSAIAAETVTDYITIKSAAGATIKLAVVS